MDTLKHMDIATWELGIPPELINHLKLKRPSRKKPITTFKTCAENHEVKVAMKIRFRPNWATMESEFSSTVDLCLSHV